MAHRTGYYRPDTKRDLRDRFEIRNGTLVVDKSAHVATAVLRIGELVDTKLHPAGTLTVVDTFAKPEKTVYVHRSES
ncbi:MAG TPA: hypothetical protein VF163_18150 [Micromonosporaceae bacterium]